MKNGFKSLVYFGAFCVIVSSILFAWAGTISTKETTRADSPSTFASTFIFNDIFSITFITANGQNNTLRYKMNVVNPSKLSTITKINYWRHNGSTWGVNPVVVNPPFETTLPELYIYNEPPLNQLVDMQFRFFEDGNPVLTIKLNVKHPSSSPEINQPTITLSNDDNKHFLPTEVPPTRTSPTKPCYCNGDPDECECYWWWEGTRYGECDCPTCVHTEPEVCECDETGDCICGDNCECDCENCHPIILPEPCTCTDEDDCDCVDCDCANCEETDNGGDDNTGGDDNNGDGSGDNGDNGTGDNGGDDNTGDGHHHETPGETPPSNPKGDGKDNKGKGKDNTKMILGITAGAVLALGVISGIISGIVGFVLRKKSNGPKPEKPTEPKAPTSPKLPKSASAPETPKVASPHTKTAPKSPKSAPKSPTKPQVPPTKPAPKTPKTAPSAGKTTRKKP